MYFDRNPLDYIDWLQQWTEGRSGKFEDYYPASARGNYKPENEEQLYRAGNVIWDGIEGHMVRIPAENVVWNPQNILDGDKLIAIAEGIKETHDVILRAGWGDLQKIDIDHIKESIEYARDDERGVLTTGDEELDEFLIDPGEVITNYHDTDEPEKFCEKLQEFKEALQEAIDNEEGDIGDWHFTPTDGHHRIFGAILSGEPYVWVMLSTSQISRVRRGRHKYAEEIAEMLE